MTASHETMRERLSKLKAAMSDFGMDLQEDKLGGVGLLLTVIDGGFAKVFMVDRILPDSSAEKCAQILPGDALLAVDDVILDAHDMTDIRDLIGGPIGTDVTLTFQRSPADPAAQATSFTVKLERHEEDIASMFTAFPANGDRIDTSEAFVDHDATGSPSKPSASQIMQGPFDAVVDQVNAARAALVESDALFAGVIATVDTALSQVDDQMPTLHSMVDGSKSEAEKDIVIEELLILIRAYQSTMAAEGGEAHRQQIDALNAHIQQLESRNSETESRLLRSDQNLRESRAENDRLSRELSDLRNELARLRQDIADLEATNTAFLEQNEGLRKDLGVAGEELLSARDSIRAMSNATEQEDSEMQAMIRSLRMQVEAAKDTNNELISANTELQKEVEELRAELERMKRLPNEGSRPDDAQSDSDNVATKESKLHSLDRGHVLASALLERANNGSISVRNSSLAALLQASSDSSPHGADQRAGYREHGSEGDEQSEDSNLKAAMQSARVDSLNDELTRQRASLEDAEREIASLTKELSQRKTAERGHLEGAQDAKKRCVNLEAEISQLQGVVKAKDQELRNLRGRIESVESQLSASEHKLKQKDREVCSLSDSKRDKEASLAGLRAKLATSEKQIASMNQDMQGLKRKAAVADSRCAQAHEAMGKMKSDLDILQRSSNEAEAKCKDLESKRDDLHKQLQTALTPPPSRESGIQACSEMNDSSCFTDDLEMGLVTMDVHNVIIQCPSLATVALQFAIDAIEVPMFLQGVKVPEHAKCAAHSPSLLLVSSLNDVICDSDLLVSRATPIKNLMDVMKLALDPDAPLDKQLAWESGLVLAMMGIFDTHRAQLARQLKDEDISTLISLAGSNSRDPFLRRLALLCICGLSMHSSTRPRLVRCCIVPTVVPLLLAQDEKTMAYAALLLGNIALDKPALKVFHAHTTCLRDLGELLKLPLADCYRFAAGAIRNLAADDVMRRTFVRNSPLLARLQQLLSCGDIKASNHARAALQNLGVAV